MGAMKDLHVKLDEGDLGAITDAELSYLDESDAAAAERVRRFRRGLSDDSQHRLSNAQKTMSLLESQAGLDFMSNALGLLAAAPALLIAVRHCAETCPCLEGCDLCNPALDALEVFHDSIELYHDARLEACQP